MFESSNYFCDVCDLRVEVGSDCWINFQLPGEPILSGLHDIRFEIKKNNSAIICEQCSKKISAIMSLEKMKEIVKS